MNSTILEKEINEQPSVIQLLLEKETEHIARLAAMLQGQFQHVVIAARGTSDNAARYAQYVFAIHNSLSVALATPSVYTLYRRPPRLDGALVVGVSQSGQSPDIVSVVDEGRRQGRPTLAITNDSASPLAGAAEHVVTLHAGHERAVAASKTYTASLAALALFSALLEKDSRRMAHLHRVPDHMKNTLSALSHLAARVERYRYMEHCAVIGRGYNYSTAFEIALKIKELTYSVAEPYSSADFRHGPIATIRNGFPVFVVAPKGPVLDDMRSFISDLAEMDSDLLIVSDDEALLNYAQLPLPYPSGVPEWLTPLVTVLHGQLFALLLAQTRGLDPDTPRGLRKVTETW